MKRTRWLNCIETKPIRIGYYEVRLWESNDVPAHYGSVIRYYFDGKNWRENKNSCRLVGDDRPGWHMMDEWRGVVKSNVE